MSGRWVHETRFGIWFQGTWMWKDYVLGGAVEDLARLVGPTSFERILDAGCGDGSAFSMLEKHFTPDHIFAIDVDPALVALALVAGRQCGCRVDVANSSVEKLELPDASIDMVFCHQTVHHLSDQASALHEFHRVLKPGGLLLLSESCKRFIHSLAVRALFRHPKGVQKTADEYADLVRASGFEIRNVSHPYPFWSRPDMGLLELLGRPVPDHPRPTLVNIAAARPA